MDGNGDGAGGDDFTLTFRVDQANRFENGQFDCVLDPWILESTQPNEIQYSSEDADGSSVSGSAHLLNLTASTDFALGQCVPVFAGVGYDFKARVKLAAQPGINLTVGQQCDFFALEGCAGSATMTAVESIDLEDTDGEWVLLESEINVPEDVVSAMCKVSLHTPTGEDFDAYLDALSLPIPAAIFADGLETGDLSAWSSTVGGN